MHNSLAALLDIFDSCSFEPSTPKEKSDLAQVRNALSLIPASAADIASGALESLHRLELVTASYLRMAQIIDNARQIAATNDTRDDPTYASNLDLESAVDDTERDEAEPSVECAYGDPDLEPSPDSCFCCGTIFSDEDRSHLMVDPQDFKCPNPRCSSNPA